MIYYMPNTHYLRRVVVKVVVTTAVVKDRAET
jgi:hypothetical protein